MKNIIEIESAKEVLVPEEPVPNVYTFDCPIHGLEIGSHCYRASDSNHLDRWYVTPLVLNTPTDSDLKKIKLQMGIHGNSVQRHHLPIKSP